MRPPPVGVREAGSSLLPPTMQQRSNFRPQQARRGMPHRRTPSGGSNGDASGSNGGSNGGLASLEVDRGGGAESDSAAVLIDDSIID